MWLWSGPDPPPEGQTRTQSTPEVAAAACVHSQNTHTELHLCQRRDKAGKRMTPDELTESHLLALLDNAALFQLSLVHLI